MSEVRIQTEACMRSFNEVLRILRSGEQIHTVDFSLDQLADEFGRFKVWCGNTGALQKGHSSLDYRLGEAPIIHSNTAKFVQQISDSLHAILAIIKGQRRPFDELIMEESENESDNLSNTSTETTTTDQAAQQAESAQRLLDIASFNSRLFKVAMMVRNSPNQGKSLRPFSLKWVDKDTGQEIFTAYHNHDSKFVEELFRSLRSSEANPPDDNFLITRCADSITCRRKYFRYWKIHRKKLGARVSIPFRPQLPLQQTENPAGPLNQHLPSPDDQVLLGLRGPSDSHEGSVTLLSGTQVSTRPSPADDTAELEVQSLSSYATTARDLSGNAVDLPLAPSQARKRQDFECPYCFIICPSVYGSQPRAWRSHLLRDLRPYICTYADCPNSDQLFSSRLEWLQHEATHRKRWRCPHHEYAVYNSRDLLVNHFRERHSEGLTNEQIESISDMGKVSAPDERTKCPLCLKEVTDVQRLHSHLANHLERVARFALPRNQELADDEAVSLLVDIPLSSSRSCQGDSNELPSGSGPSALVPLGGEYPWKYMTVPTAREMIKLAVLVDGTRDVPFFAQTCDIPVSLIFESAAKLLAEMGAKLEKRESSPNDLYFKSTVLYLDSHNTRAFEDEPSFQLCVLIDDDEIAAEERFYVAPDQLKQEWGFRSPLDVLVQSGLRDDMSQRRKPIKIAQLPALPIFYDRGLLTPCETSTLPNPTLNAKVSVTVRSITSLVVDVIINPSDTTLSGGGGLDAEIQSRGGRRMKSAVKALRGCQLGEAKITEAYDDPFVIYRNVIHVATDYFDHHDQAASWEKLRQCYRNSLLLALRHGLRTIALPAIGTGMNSYPCREAAEVAISEVRNFLQSHNGAIQRIVLCPFTTANFVAYKKAITKYFPPASLGESQLRFPRDIEDLMTRCGDKLTSEICLSSYKDLDDIGRYLHRLLTAYLEICRTESNSPTLQIIRDKVQEVYRVLMPPLEGLGILEILDGALLMDTPSGSTVTINDDLYRASIQAVDTAKTLCQETLKVILGGDNIK